MRSRTWTGGAVVAALVLLVVLGVGLLYAYRSQTPAIPTVSETEVVREVEAGAVRDVVIDDTRATVTLTRGSQVRTFVANAKDGPLITAVDRYNRDHANSAVTLRYESSGGLAAWPMIGVALLPILLIAALILFAARALARARDGDRYDQLARIADLRDRHALTEDEFEAEKRKIMR